MEHYGANKNARCKRARLSQLKNVDLATYECYQKARSKNIPVTGPMLQEKTKRANEELGDATFKASTGWLDRFKKRYNITSKVISGEAGGISEETSILERAPNEYFERLLYRKFFKHGRDRIILSSTAKQISCRGVKAVHQGGKIQKKSDLRFFCQCSRRK